MSNKRNPRRRRQRVRSEIERKPKIITKSMATVFAAIPAERERKAVEHEREQFRLANEKRIRRWAREVAWTPRKLRTNYGHTYWTHSHDI